MLGQADLAAWIEVTTGERPWSVQDRISTLVQRYRSRVTVPSCNASGKTWLAARIALAFYDSFTPGAQCQYCRGPCGGSKIITTSSKFEHLRDNVWGELRRTRARLARRGISIPGRFYEGDNLRLEAGPDHFIIGQNPRSAEGMQGYHAPHKLIIGDEATAISEELASGITGLLASADSRLFLIANPTTPETWFASLTRSKGVEVVRITAWDTPMFTDEPVPEGANLITPAFLTELEHRGMGPGTYEWTTRVEAQFWDLGEDNLIPGEWVERARSVEPFFGGTRALGIDLATYGSGENVIAFRRGNVLEEVRAFPSMRQEHFWQGPVTKAVLDFAPHFVVYDADGVGAGVSGEADRLNKHLPPGGQVVGFRGAIKVAPQYLNARSAWWWFLRRKLEAGRIHWRINDLKTEEQITQLHYTVTAGGAIKVESKEEMRKRGLESPDRGDAVMYSFALSEELDVPVLPPAAIAQTGPAGTYDRSEHAMWDRDIWEMERGRTRERDAVWGNTDW